MSNRLKTIAKQRVLRKARIKSRVKGTTDKPRMSVAITNKHVVAQLIDDTTHKTIVSATTVGKKSVTGTMTEKAQWVGTEIAKKAKAKKVKTISFDRGAKQYHGRVKALADAAREAGLEF